MKRLPGIAVLMLIFLGACAPVETPTLVAPRIAPSVTPIEAPTRTTTVAPSPTVTPEPQFSFSVTTDMSEVSGREYIDYPNFFAALLGYLKDAGPGDFMVSTGDVLPAEETRWTIDQVLGEDYLWYPLPGNHDFGTADYAFLRNYDYDPNGPAEPNIVNQGPAPCPHTTYSFDYQNAHFVALNVYCNEESPWGIDGGITDVIYDWLAADLAATDAEHIFVFGHEPAFPWPDEKTGLVRHLGWSLDEYPEARDRFWQLLKAEGVAAYFSGHSHNYSAALIDGVWQIEAGQAMGTRAAPSPGTFLIVTVDGADVTLETYRGEDGPGFAYFLTDSFQIAP
ncbi:MAG: metallophosphoesterase family protein [Chloroflexota bacterium]|nr:metallophosphoesterase family protein [Chloroflexota bacterium]